MDRNIAVVGCGYWGKNLVRNFAELGALHTICDSSSTILRELEALYLGVSAVPYAQLLGQVDSIEPPYLERNCKSLRKYYTVGLKDSRLNRGELRRYLDSKRIQTAVYYPLSLHLQEVYNYLGHKPGEFPQSELAQEQVLTLPMYPELSEKQIEKIAEVISKSTEGD
jgi:dTDP-4-amino-4,6-dideoxygalactose transaminase